MKTCSRFFNATAATLACAIFTCATAAFVFPAFTAAQGPGAVDRSAITAAYAAAAKKATPRTADGHPDLNGYWDTPKVNPASFYQAEGDKNIYLFGKDFGGPQKTLQPPRPDPNPPSYKPELQAKVKEMGDNAETKDTKDPSWGCNTLGVPRLGTPRQIVATPSLVVLIYQPDSGTGTTPGNEVRVVPTDGRAHRTDLDPSPWGDSVGHWDGDTLVVDVTGFSTDTWLSQRGYFHTKALHIVERFTRKGDTLVYQATAEDPNVMTKPWEMPARTLVFTNDLVIPNPVCSERDIANF